MDSYTEIEPGEYKEGFIGKSMLQAWIQCPRKFQYMFLDQRPRLTGVAVSRGQSFHSIANEFFDWIDQEYLLSLKTYLHTRDYFRGLIPNDLPRELRSYCRNFADFEAGEWMKLQDTLEPLRLFIPVLREKYIEAESTKCNGHVDRIDRMRDGNYIVIDYKSGRYENLPSIRRELTFYALEVVNPSKILNKPVTWIGYYNPQTERQLAEPLNPWSRAALEKQLSRMRASVQVGDFPKKEGLQCMWCWFNYVCAWEDDNDHT